VATLAVGGASAAGAFTAVPYVGWILAIGAAYWDATQTYPKLLGDGKNSARPPRFLDVPTLSNAAGAPRVWAIGARVRVPTHVLWQTEKVREGTAGSSKSGTQVNIRRVYIDTLVALNDRRTESLHQLIGNGKLLLYKSRNVVSVTTSQMGAFESTGVIVVHMASLLEPDLTDKFRIGDVVKPSGFTKIAGPDGFNDTYWVVTSVGAHQPGQPSSMLLAAQDGQTVTSMEYSGGNVFAPATIERVDDAIVNEMAAVLSIGPLFGSAVQVMILRRDVGGQDFSTIFSAGDIVHVRDVQTINPAHEWRVFLTYDNEIWLIPLTTTYTLGSYSPTATNDVVKIEFVDQPLFTAGLFPPTFVPSDHYFGGSETQGESALLAADKGTGNIPAYRGVAYQGLDQFFATQFGDQLPFSLEAIIDPDLAMTWREAVSEVLQRAAIPIAAIDTTGVSALPFAGMYLRGAVPTASAMQPMLLAGQIVGQERDGTIAAFDVENCDVVQVENGEQFSDLGCRIDGTPAADDKIRVEDQDERDLPTSVGIRHQDPDNLYADGYQHFGLRNPGGVDHQNEQEVDLSNLVLTRKQAREIATTLLRRAWVNRRQYRFNLPCAYLDVLENDIITMTDDDGNVIRCRVVQRDIGNDFRVTVVAVAEDVDLAVYGSPVQTSAGTSVPSVLPPAYLRVVPLDAPGITNDTVDIPGIKLAVCAENGGEHWAGAAVYESVNGASYQQVGSVGRQAAIGTFDDELTAEDPSEEYGTSTVTVRSQDVDVTFGYEGDTPIEAATQAEAEAGKNWCMILSDVGVEVAAFTTVTPNGARNYTLGGWLRGLRGTTGSARVAGSQIVLLHPDGGNVFHREFPGSILPSTLDYKVVPFGASIDDITEISVTATWVNARPLPVRAIQSTVGASPFDAKLEVVAHWTRAVLPLGAQPPHPMDEPFESYLFVIYDPTGATIERIKPLTAQGTGSPTLRDKFVTYTAAEQTDDGYTPDAAETFIVDVLQVGEFGESPSIKQEI
jgi:hypothetical protein